MKTKAKKFSHKLLALLMALVMGITCFSGVLTSYAASNNIGYNDKDVELNDIAWNVLSDEQLATAILDYADSILPSVQEFESNIYAMLGKDQGMEVATGVKIIHNLSKRNIQVKIIGITAATITLKLGSVDELFETINSVQSALSGIISTAGKLGVNLGIVQKLDLSAVNGMRRTNTSSCDIVRGVLGMIYDNNTNIIGDLLRGTFTVGLVDSAFGDNGIYGLIGNALGAPAGYQSDFVYNIAQTLIFNYTKWYTADEIAAFQAGTAEWIFDDQLLDKMTTELLDKINVLVTYPDGTSSESRRKEIQTKMDAGMTYEAACGALGYDPNLVYSEENEGNILLFAYGNDKIRLTTGDSLFSFGYQALKFAWRTVLKDTVKLIHVNYNVERGHGTNFDNNYYYWASGAFDWSQTDLASNYTQAHLNDWANHIVNGDLKYDADKGQWVDKLGVAYSNTTDKSDSDGNLIKDENGRVIQTAEMTLYNDYGAASADEFLSWVKNNYEFDRTAADDAEGKWSDIDATTLFNKLRYSPLADYAFDMQTGPINLYFMQTGTPNLDAFFDTYLADTYSSLAGGLNDCLVAAVKDLFPNRDNIYTSAKGDTARPDMATINPSTIDNAANILIANTLVGNALKVIQYVADTTDQNILNGFYKVNGPDAVLSETNLEGAMVPLLISCVNQIWIADKQLKDMIHPEDWDMCKDAEAIAFVALRENLSFSLPNKDYNTLLVNYAAYKAGTATEYDVDFEATIMPMARDALVYVIEPYVPVTYNGQRWTASTTEIAGADVTIFDIFNEIVCYYADDYTGTDWKNANRGSSETALGAASLLGICDANGNSLINTSNDLWTNLNIAINKLLPVVGTLQGYGYGNADSKKLIYNDIIMGILDIGTPNADTGMGGVTNFIYRFLTIVSAEPIQTTPIVTTVYNFLKDLINGLFGPRYNGQTWVPIPDATSAHPFDDLFHVGQLAGTADAPGALPKMINNFVEFSGYGYNGVATYPDSILAGLTFAVSAVNSFFNFMGRIGEHTLGMASAEFKDDVVTGVSSGNNFTTTLSLKNTSTGINSAYLDIDGEVQQMSRYYVQPTGLTVTSGQGKVMNVSQPSSALIAPDKKLDMSVTTTFTPDSSANCSYEAVFTYNICDENGNVLYSDLSTMAYQFMSGAAGWYDTAYPSDRIDGNGIHMFPQKELENDTANQTMTYNGVETKTTPIFGSEAWVGATKKSPLNVLYPTSIVVDTADLSITNTMGFRLRNNSSSGRSMDGVYCYDNKTVLSNNLTTAATEYTTSTSTVTVNKSNAIPVFDKTTGDLLRQGLYDVSYDSGANWDRTGVDEAGKEAILNNETVDKNTLVFRTHVAYTLQEALNAGIIAAYYINSSNVYEHIYLKTGGGTNYDTTLGQISMRGPVDGYYINSNKITQGKTSSSYFTFLMYDGTTDVKQGVYNFNVNFYTSSLNNGLASIQFIVTDTSNSSELDSAYNSVATTLNNYLPSDFTDVDSNGESAIYNNAKAALLKALAAKAAPLSIDIAKSFINNTVLTPTTTVTTSATGDVAYAPFQQGVNDSTIPASVKANAYIGGSTVAGVTYGGVTGVYYFDSNCTMPIYNTNEPLTAAKVTNGQDPAGKAVTAVTDKSGNTTYYLTNAPHYETEWDTTNYGDYPYLAKTSTQATNDKGDLLYEQIQYVYRDANGDKVNSNENPACKFPATEYSIVENTPGTENRSLYNRCIDLLSYHKEILETSVDDYMAQYLLSDVSLVREGLEESNFDIISYNKMVKAAKNIENKYQVYFDYTVDEPVYDESGAVIKDAEGKVVTQAVPHSITTSYSDYKGYINRKDVTIDKSTVRVVSSLSSTQIQQYLNEFNKYLGFVVERGYIGNQLEAEILCASNGAYSDFTVTAPVKDAETGKITTNGTVSSTSVAAPAFGAYVDGQLVNQGDVIYPSNLWNNYVNALATAISVAQTGNGDYAHKTSAYYNAADKDNYTAQVVACYNYDTALQTAEIALENTNVVTLTSDGGSVMVNGVDGPYTGTTNIALVDGEYATFTATPAAESLFSGFTVDGVNVDQADITVNEDGTYSFSTKIDKDMAIAAVYQAAATDITVSGKVVIANTTTGGASNYGLGGIEIVANGVVVGTSAADGTFTVTVPQGTTELVAQRSKAVYARTVTLRGDADITGAVIPVIMGDYNDDQLINGTDKVDFSKSLTNYSVYCDYNCDGLVNGTDKTSFAKFIGVTPDNYSALALD